MEDFSVLIVVLGLHVGIAVFSVLMIYVLDISPPEQKKAQAWVCLLLPFVGSFLIVSFTIYEKMNHRDPYDSSGNPTSITNDNGADLYIGQRQHQSVSSGSSDD